MSIYRMSGKERPTVSEVRDKVLAAAKVRAQARGYGGLNFRELATDVGIKSASLHYYFPTKSDLGVAVARRYCDESGAALEAMWDRYEDPVLCLGAYPGVFREALENQNRMCLCGFMAAEYDDLPGTVKVEVKAFADIHVAWLTRMLTLSGACTDAEAASKRAAAIFAAVSGAQLMARGRADATMFDAVIEGYCAVGLLPTHRPSDLGPTGNCQEP